MGSVRRRGDRVRVSLEAGEVSLVLFLTAQVLDVLGPAREVEESLEALLEAATTPVERPRDPVTLRLLPDAYSDDAGAAGEFRRLTESDLRETKRVALGRMVDDLTATDAARPGGGIRLDLAPDTAAAWLPALTDVRLALGTRIGVTDDIDAERERTPEDSPRYAEIATYDWISWFQDAVVRAVMGD